MNKPLPDGETLSLYIDPAMFRQSVHNQETWLVWIAIQNISTYPHPAFQPNSTRDVRFNYIRLQELSYRRIR